MLKLPNIKTIIKHKIIIGLLMFIILLNNFTLVAQFLGRLNPLAWYQQEIKGMKEHTVLLEFDRVRLEDISNIILALQDYQFDNKVFPEKLEVLKEKGYLNPNARLVDPGTDKPYFYLKDTQGAFVLCIWLSDMIKGVQTAQCPSSTPEIINNEGEKEETISTKTSEPKPEEQKLEIVGDTTYVNVREESTTKSSIITRVAPGDQYIFTEIQGNWYHIIIDDIKRGWVRNDYTTPVIDE